MRSRTWNHSEVITLPEFSQKSYISDNLYLYQPSLLDKYISVLPIVIIGTQREALRIRLVRNSCSRLFPGIPASHSRSPNLGMRFFIPMHVPKNWECYFSFPFPKFGNGLSNSRSRSQSQKTIPAHP